MSSVRQPTVRTIDWRNRVYTKLDRVDEMYAGEFDVRDGVAIDPQSPSDRLRIGEPEFGDVTGDGVEDVIVIAVYGGGGTGRFSNALVYTMVDSEPTLIGAIPGGDRHDGGLVEVGIEATAGIEVRRRGPGIESCPDCNILIEHWRWRHGSFARDDELTTVSR